MPPLPAFPSHVNNRGNIANSDGTELQFTIVDEVSLLQRRYASGGDPRKTLVLQRIRFDNGAVEIRSCYYMLQTRPGQLPDWVWARSAQLAPIGDFVSLVRKAEDLGWFKGVLGEL